MNSRGTPLGRPMTVGNMRELGVQNLIASCLSDACRHTVITTGTTSNVWPGPWPLVGFCPLPTSARFCSRVRWW
jgi:hypothetical protein